MATNNAIRFGVKAFNMAYNIDQGIGKFYYFIGPFWNNDGRMGTSCYGDEIEKALRGNSINTIPGANMVEKMVAIIGLEAKVNKTKVGGPVDVLKIYRGGHKWYLDKPIK